jgi:hypothetical protein
VAHHSHMLETDPLNFFVGHFKCDSGANEGPYWQVFEEYVESCLYVYDVGVQGCCCQLVYRGPVF